MKVDPVKFNVVQALLGVSQLTIMRKHQDLVRVLSNVIFLGAAVVDDHDSIEDFAQGAGIFMVLDAFPHAYNKNWQFVTHHVLGALMCYFWREKWARPVYEKMILLEISSIFRFTSYAVMHDPLLKNVPRESLWYLAILFDVSFLAIRFNLHKQEFDMPPKDKVLWRVFTFLNMYWSIVILQRRKFLPV